MKELVIEAVIKAQQDKIGYNTVYINDIDLSGKNEFLFFIKPELVMQNNNDNLPKILDMIFSKMDEFSLNIRNISVCSSGYLKRHEIMSEHYGVINHISSKGSHTISNQAKRRFNELFGKSIEQSNVYGSIEYLEKNKNLNSYTLDIINQNSSINKLSGGTYCIKFNQDGEEVFVLNAFHPRQLEHFTEQSRCIVCMELFSDTSWKKTRQNFIGETNPKNANLGSIRRTLYENHDNFGLTEVSRGTNGVHLSAGAVESLVELMRYGSNLDVNLKKKIGDYAFGQALLEKFNSNQIQKILANVNMEVDNEPLSVFDATEELCSNDALEFISKHL